MSKLVAELPAQLISSKTATSQAAPLHHNIRIDYLDNLRALAMLLGVYLHAALAYADPAQSIWLATDTQSRVWIDVSIWWIHLFRMGLFFLLAGYFAKMVYARRGLAGFLASRALRIIGPFVLFYPLLLVAMTLVIVFSLSYQVNPQGLMGYIAAAEKSSTDNDASPPGTMHLWFLYYLLWFTLASVIVARLNWFGTLKKRWHPLVSISLPLLLVPPLVVAGNPIPAPESFIPTWWPFVFYGWFYVAGWRLWGNESLLERLSTYRWQLFVVSAALFIPYYCLLPQMDLSAITTSLPRVNTETLIVSILGAYLSVSWIMVALVFGKRWLNYRSGLLRIVADSSYWVYLVHLPIVIFLQTLLIPLSWPAEIKLFLTVLFTVLPCWASYLVFVRYTPLGWLLHGKRTFP